MKTERIFCLGIVILIASVLSVGASETIGFTVVETGQSGNRVTLAVSIGKAPGDAAAFGLDIVYDTKVLKYKESERGDLVKEGFRLFGVSEPEKGTLRIGAVEPGEKIIKKGSSGTLVYLVFDIVGNGECDLKPARLKDDVRMWPVKNGHFIGKNAKQK